PPVFRPICAGRRTWRWRKTNGRQRAGLPALTKTLARGRKSLLPRHFQGASPTGCARFQLAGCFGKLKTCPTFGNSFAPSKSLGRPPGGGMGRRGFFACRERHTPTQRNPFPTQRNGKPCKESRFRAKKRQTVQRIHPKG